MLCKIILNVLWYTNGIVSIQVDQKNTSNILRDNVDSCYGVKSDEDDWGKRTCLNENESIRFFSFFHKIIVLNLTLILEDIANNIRIPFSTLYDAMFFNAPQ